MDHPIPPMTHPLGRHWHQPPRERVEVDGTHALLQQGDFERLPEYSTTLPSGVYPGKMWRRQERPGQWWLVWFGIVAGDETRCSINRREILLV